MESREKSRNCKSRESAIKEKDDKDKKYKIKDLMQKIKITTLQESDIISYLIINSFTEKNYSSLNVNEIHTLLSKSKKYEDSLKKYNLRNEIIISLKNNDIFHEKSKNKYELYLDRTLIYLTSYLETSVTNSNINGSNSISKMSKKSIIENNIENGLVQYSPVFSFPEEQNSIVNFNVEDNSQQQKLSCYSSDDGNAFTFGENSQINGNRINNKFDDEEIIVKYSEEELKKFMRNNFTDEEFNELEKKSNEKFIDNFETLFDKNKYLSNLAQNLKNLFQLYKKNNENRTDFSDLNNKLGQIYLLINEIEVNQKTNYINYSTSFNEKKLDLINIFKAIKSQYDSCTSLKSIDSKDKSLKSLQENEKEMIKELINEIKNVFEQLQDDYESTKLCEKQINENISNIKLNLRKICDEFLEKKKELYNDFYTLVNNIEKIQIELIKVNINDTVKCFYCYIDEVEKYYLDI